MDDFQNLNFNKKEQDLNIRKRLLNEINEKLSTIEYCEKWFKEFGPFEKDCLESILKICEREFEEFALRKLSNESDLKYSAIETIAKRCIQIEIHKQNDDSDAALNYATETLLLIKECVEKGYFSDIYAAGFKYVIKCSEIVLKVKMKVNDVSLEELEEMVVQLKTFDSFNDTDKAAILALKQYILGIVNREGHDIQIQIIKKMIALDPENLEWRNCLYVIMVFKRQLSQNKYEPTSEEKTAIIEANNLPGAQHDPRIRLGYIMCLANIVSHSSKSGSSVISFGSETFLSCRAAVDFIRNEADEILAIDPMSVRTNVNIAKIFTSILPKQFRNTEFARICIDRALLFHPGNSKANHRMALLMLSTERFDEAVEYFEKAVEGDERNVFAIRDLIKLYLRNTTKYQAQLQKLFEKLLDHPNYKNKPDQIAEFLFLKSLQKFFENDLTAGVRCLIDSYKKKSKITDQFKNIDYEQRRFKWNKEVFFEAQFQMLLQQTELNTFDSVEKLVLRNILSAFRATRTSRGQRGGAYGFGNTGFKGSNYKRNSYSRHSYGSHYHSQHDNGSSHKENNNNSFLPAANKNNWSVLGLTKTATEAEIKIAYKKLAREKHPDKNTHLPEQQRKEKQEEMKLINVAYETLIKKN